MKKYFIRFLVQGIVCLFAALAVYLLRPARIVYAIGRWVLMPSVGAYTSYKLKRFGINEYCAWIIPPVMHTLGALTVSGYLPGFGSVLLTAAASLIGAAAAAVQTKRKRHKGHR